MAGAEGTVPSTLKKHSLRNWSGPAFPAHKGLQKPGQNLNFPGPSSQGVWAEFPRPGIISDLNRRCFSSRGSSESHPQNPCAMQGRPSANKPSSPCRCF